jgi:hypothetical protein
MVVSVFNEIWYNLLGNRTALYHNADAKKQGALTVVSILDTVDGQKFYDRMAHLAEIANGDLKPAQPGAKGGLKVEQLVKDLGSTEARKKELAFLKLRLLGGPALPFLEEMGVEAKSLHDEIAKLVEERKKGAPAGNWFLKLRPTLSMQPKTENHVDLTVHVGKLRMPKQAKELSGDLEKLFGPQWDHVRFAVHGKNVVVVWGSNTDLLIETLNNLKDGKLGLGDSKHLKTFYTKSGDARRLEMHFAVDPLMALFDAGPAGLPKTGGQPLSSLGLSVEPDSLQLDFWVPLGQTRLLAKLLNL